MFLKDWYSSVIGWIAQRRRGIYTIFAPADYPVEAFKVMIYVFQHLLTHYNDEVIAKSEGDGFTAGLKVVDMNLIMKMIVSFSYEWGSVISLPQINAKSSVKGYNFANHEKRLRAAVGETESAARKQLQKLQQLIDERTCVNRKDANAVIDSIRSIRRYARDRNFDELMAAIDSFQKEAGFIITLDQTTLNQSLHHMLNFLQVMVTADPQLFDRFEYDISRLQKLANTGVDQMYYGVKLWHGTWLGRIFNRLQSKEAPAGSFQCELDTQTTARVIMLMITQEDDERRNEQNLKRRKKREVVAAFSSN